ncbi:MAG: hypothetical protein JWP61_2046 [Friedmanniella sp.]|nr:hypothetical protein [Friedmanniella sp.]
MNRVELRLTESGHGAAILTWGGAPDPRELEQSLHLLVQDRLAGDGFRRLEVWVQASDTGARRALLRAGFRCEGRRREAVRTAGGLDDEMLYGRLASDVVGGTDGFSGVMNSALPRKRLIAHVLIRDEQDRVLLCDTRFKRDWELPGGVVEPGEPPRLGAAREVLEELGVDRPVGPMLVADWMPPYLGWEDALELIFDGGRVHSADLHQFTLQAAEILAVRLCTLTEAAELLTPLAHRRLTVAAGLAPGTMAYLEDGRPA